MPTIRNSTPFAADIADDPTSIKKSSESKPELADISCPDEQELPDLPPISVQNLWKEIETESDPEFQPVFSLQGKVVHLCIGTQNDKASSTTGELEFDALCACVRSLIPVEKEGPVDHGNFMDVWLCSHQYRLYDEPLSVGLLSRLPWTFVHTSAEAIDPQRLETVDHILAKARLLKTSTEDEIKAELFRFGALALKDFRRAHFQSRIVPLMQPDENARAFAEGIVWEAHYATDYDDNENVNDESEPSRFAPSHVLACGYNEDNPEYFLPVNLELLACHCPDLPIVPKGVRQTRIREASETNENRLASTAITIVDVLPSIFVRVLDAQNLPLVVDYLMSGDADVFVESVLQIKLKASTPAADSSPVPPISSPDGRETDSTCPYPNNPTIFRFSVFELGHLLATTHSASLILIIANRLWCVWGNVFALKAREDRLLLCLDLMLSAVNAAINERGLPAKPIEWAT
ncbi:hypothetical protein DFH11DRAFT_382037 [Phellopilus nigrolimitatus]|nr:hypothetical protein DFH11DRAFT_382037 [Phellopilus nigrolimitatus]